MLFHRKRFLRLAELWYDDPLPQGGVDVVLFNQAPAPLPGMAWEEKSTIIIDLTKTEETLMAEMRKSDRIKIRNAREKDNVQCEILEKPDLSARKNFYDFYDQFARAKGLPILDRGLLEQMALQGGLVLSRARCLDLPPAEELLVCHATYVYKTRARALYSASVRLEKDNADRLNLIGRANRLLHWEDMRWARARGLPLYDFGGWYAGAVDAQRLAINQFKEGFGGEKVLEYEAIHGLTFLGRLGVAIWKRRKGH